MKYQLLVKWIKRNWEKHVNWLVKSPHRKGLASDNRIEKIVKYPTSHNSSKSLCATLIEMTNLWWNEWNCIIIIVCPYKEEICRVHWACVINVFKPRWNGFHFSLYLSLAHYLFLSFSLPLCLLSHDEGVVCFYYSSMDIEVNKEWKNRWIKSVSIQWSPYRGYKYALSRIIQVSESSRFPAENKWSALIELDNSTNESSAVYLNVMRARTSPIIRSPISIEYIYNNWLIKLESFGFFLGVFLFCSTCFACALSNVARLVLCVALHFEPNGFSVFWFQLNGDFYQLAIRKSAYKLHLVPWAIQMKKSLPDSRQSYPSKKHYKIRRNVCCCYISVFLQLS